MVAANSKLSYEGSFQQCLVEENRKKMEALNLPQIALQAHRSPVFVEGVLMPGRTYHLTGTRIRSLGKTVFVLR